MLTNLWCKQKQFNAVSIGIYNSSVWVLPALFVTEKRASQMELGLVSANLEKRARTHNETKNFLEEIKSVYLCFAHSVIRAEGVEQQ